MTGRPWPLDDYDLFGRDAALAPANVATDPAIAEASLEEVRLEAFDTGYKAGWEDAEKAHQEDLNHISAEFAHNLQEMRFTYQEARQATMRDTEVLFRGMIESVLPKSLPDALVATVMERLIEGVDAASQPMVEVTVAPENVVRLERLIEGAEAPPLRICPEDSLGPGQAFLRFERGEERVDLQAVLNELSTIVEDLFAPLEEDT